jgi:hypothetical protein
MTKSSCSFPDPTALDYENTLVLAIDLSNANWVLAAQVPGLLRVKAKQTIEPRTEALLAAIRNPAVQGDTLSHLNSSRQTPRKWLFRLGCAP